MGDNPPIIYLNNAATTWPKPPEVLEAVRQSLALPVFGSGRTTGSQGEDYITLAREALADLLAADPPEHVIFTQNATDSLNVLIGGFLAGETGCHVLTTELDHNSVLRPLHELERQGRIRLTVLPFENGSVSPDAVRAAITPDTRLMVTAHGSNVLGSVQDVARIGETLHDHGVYFIVDGAQTAGHIPVDLGNLPVDAYVFTGHKGLLGIPGTGGFYLRDPESIAPLRYGGTGTDSFSLFQPREMPERFEVGTHNYPGLAALAAGVNYIAAIGVEAVAEKAERQTAFLIGELKEEPNIMVYNESPVLPIVSFNIRGMENDDVGFILARAYGIVARTGLHCAPLVHRAIDGGRGSVRLSLSWFTTDEECRTAARAVKEIARNANSSLGSP
ncbi:MULTISPECIES: aminotransferase class V-fold PLP-dependent enzyme [Methanoculleus]|uniref:cysteine desulfurase n=2 Tax=Methanoculleus TaxID=45989 RepID=A3CTW4_METMJ|nr:MULTISPECIES: aminotransferase class V-fold PLP-dependent enzyme [Methanoculleus]ABN56814.1 aminotransferase, class V [Methanoculleus marisnigri JR1]UYU18242.1 aminotransferase class V-fold PLP-dependent enzyme [Methanoculleus submarinus]